MLLAFRQVVNSNNGLGGFLTKMLSRGIFVGEFAHRLRLWFTSMYFLLGAQSNTNFRKPHRATASEISLNIDGGLYARI